MRRLLQEERALLDNEASGPAVVEALAEQQRISDSAELEWQRLQSGAPRIDAKNGRCASGVGTSVNHEHGKR